MIETVKIQGDGYLVNGTTSVPKADGNRDYEAVKVWLQTNTAELEFTQTELLQQVQADLSNAVQSHLDSKAQEFRYDHMNSARSYAGYTNAFQAEAISLGAWASECWVYAGTVEQAVKDNLRAMPTKEELIAELPVYVGL